MPFQFVIALTRVWTQTWIMQLFAEKMMQYVYQMNEAHLLVQIVTPTVLKHVNESSIHIKCPSLRIRASNIDFVIWCWAKKGEIWVLVSLLTVWHIEIKKKNLKLFTDYQWITLSKLNGPCPKVNWMRVYGVEINRLQKDFTNVKFFIFLFFKILLWWRVVLALGPGHRGPARALLARAGPGL